MVILKIFFVLCLLQAFAIGLEAKSVMHQIYSAEYGIMATIFLCSGLIINAINNRKEIGEKNKEAEVKDDKKYK